MPIDSAIWQPSYKTSVNSALKREVLNHLYSSSPQGRNKTYHKKSYKKASNDLLKEALQQAQESLKPSGLPRASADWLTSAARSIRIPGADVECTTTHVQRLIDQTDWVAPKRPVIYITDLHADVDSFFDSLVASGGIERTGKRFGDFKLTSFGKKAHFVIGGDCFDKGPSNLRLLDGIRLVMNAGAKFTILAGNHDVRVMFGMQQVGVMCPRNSHFFVRMGLKSIPLLRELVDRYRLKKLLARNKLPDLDACREAIFPTKAWYRHFPVEAQWVMPEDKIDAEVAKVRRKVDQFEQKCGEEGLDLRLVYAAAVQFQKEFLSPKGRYQWFFDKLKIAMREGSFLFLHAGVDDRFCYQLQSSGVNQINKRFRREMNQGDPFELYYGSLFNAIRTKYRGKDLPFTDDGAQKLRSLGVHAVVRGHVSRSIGQCISVHNSIVHIDCDITLDRNSRQKEGLSGVGAGCTLFLPESRVVGISTDWHSAKLLDLNSSR